MSELEYNIIDETATDLVCELLMDSFFKDEPLGVALDLKTNEVNRWLPNYIKTILKEPVSLGVFSKDVLVAVCLNIVDTHPSLIGCIDKKTEPAMYEVARFLQLLNQGMNLETDLGLEPGSKILTTLFLNVNSSYSGKGIASKLALKVEDLARDLGVGAIQVDTTSEFSYKVYSKLDYTVLRQLDYSELKDELTGCKIIDPKKISSIHSCGRALVKIIINTPKE